MLKNYIILAHKNPKQVKRLVERLNDDETYFYIHVDKNVDIKPFEAEFFLDNVFFSHNRESSTWGDIGAVLATINCLKQVMKDKREGYCLLLSGQDYPIKTNSSINSFLTDNYGSDFIQILPVEDAWPYEEWSKRLLKYKFNLSNKRDDFLLIPSLFSNEFFLKDNLKKVKELIKRKNINVMNIVGKRKAPDSIRPYGGSQWWALTIETVAKILCFVNENNRFIRYHRFTLLSDEIFFQSILAHLCKKDPEIIIKPSITYVNWIRKNVTLPVIFTSSDIDELINQPKGMLFARKFDLEIDELILNHLDDYHIKTIL